MTENTTGRDRGHSTGDLDDIPVSEMIVFVIGTSGR